MAEETERRVVRAEKPKRRFLWGLSIMDVIIFGAVAVIAVALLYTLVTKLLLQHDVSQATKVTDMVISDIAKQDSNAALKLGTPTLKAKNTSDQMADKFKQIKPFTAHSPTIYSRTYDKNTKGGKTVFVIYRYPSKPNLFLRVVVQNLDGKWELVNIAGNSDPQQL
jgi:hypothetical protein